MVNVLQIEVRNVFGVGKIYPANEQAKRLASIAGTTTLVKNTLKKAEAMGFVIEQVPGAVSWKDLS